MCIEFQHFSCQVVVIKGLAYLLTYFIAAVIAAVDSKLKDWINFGIFCFPVLPGSAKAQST